MCSCVIPFIISAVKLRISSLNHLWDPEAPHVKPMKTTSCHTDQSYSQLICSLFFLLFKQLIIGCQEHEVDEMAAVTLCSHWSGPLTSASVLCLTWSLFPGSRLNVGFIKTGTNMKSDFVSSLLSEKSEVLIFWKICCRY